MTKLRVLDLFSGIGGFSLGLERTGGFETVAFCEIEEFPRRVLAKHWPEVPCYDDVRTLTAERLAADGIAVDVITGGFPCQDLSVAGRRDGIEGKRSGLWSEIVRLYCEIRPRFLIVENVANLLDGPSDRPGAWFGRVLGDLAEVGADAEWHRIPAASLGAAHIRERTWVLAYPAKVRREHGSADRLGRGDIAAAGEGWLQQSDGVDLRPALVRPPYPIGRLDVRDWESKSPVLRVADGVPHQLDRLGALGNSVVPQIPELIGHAILASLNERRAAA